MLSFLTAALNLAPVLVQAGQDIAPLAAKLFGMFQSGAEPTSADWDYLHALEAGETDAIDAPISGEDDGA